MTGILALAVSRPAAQQVQPATPSSDFVLAADRQILTEIKEHSELMANLEYLSDMIGPRLTGTEKMSQASRWTAEMLRKYGLQNVHLEPWTIARAWYRGTARGRMVGPTEHRLTLAAAGWRPGTAGAVRGHVVYVSARRVEELARAKARLKGRTVIIAEPVTLPADRKSTRLNSSHRCISYA